MSEATSKTAVKEKASVKEASAVDEVAKTGVAVAGIAAALIGAWGVTCLVAATITEGPVTLIKGFFGGSM